MDDNNATPASPEAGTETVSKATLYRRNWRIKWGIPYPDTGGPPPPRPNAAGNATGMSTHSMTTRSASKSQPMKYVDFAKVPMEHKTEQTLLSRLKPCDNPTAISGGADKDCYLRETTDGRKVVHAISNSYGDAEALRQQLHRFRSEFAIMSVAKQQPGSRVVDVLAYSEKPHDGGVRCSILMEFADEGDLRSYVQKFKDEHDDRWHPQNAKQVVRELVAGMKAVAAAGIAHKDLKPDNICVSSESGVQLIDFGCAESGPIMSSKRGTVSFIAPEVILLDQHDERCDVYSFGCTVASLCCGSAPFELEADEIGLNQATEDIENDFDFPDKASRVLTLAGATPQVIEALRTEEDLAHLRGFAEIVEESLQFFPDERITWSQLENHPVLAEVSAGVECTRLVVNDKKDEAKITIVSTQETGEQRTRLLKLSNVSGNCDIRSALAKCSRHMSRQQRAATERLLDMAKQTAAGIIANHGLRHLRNPELVKKRLANLQKALIDEAEKDRIIRDQGLLDGYGDNFEMNDLPSLFGDKLDLQESSDDSEEEDGDEGGGGPSAGLPSRKKPDDDRGGKGGGAGGSRRSDRRPRDPNPPSDGEDGDPRGGGAEKVRAAPPSRKKPAAKNASEAPRLVVTASERRQNDGHVDSESLLPRNAMRPVIQRRRCTSPLGLGKPTISKNTSSPEFHSSIPITPEIVVVPNLCELPRIDAPRSPDRTSAVAVIENDVSRNEAPGVEIAVETSGNGYQNNEAPIFSAGSLGDRTQQTSVRHLKPAKKKGSFMKNMKSMIHRTVDRLVQLIEYDSEDYSEDEEIEPVFENVEQAQESRSANSTIIKDHGRSRSSEGGSSPDGHSRETQGHYSFAEYHLASKNRDSFVAKMKSKIDRVLNGKWSEELEELKLAVAKAKEARKQRSADFEIIKARGRSVAQALGAAEFASADVQRNQLSSDPSASENDDSFMSKIKAKAERVLNGQWNPEIEAERIRIYTEQRAAEELIRLRMEEARGCDSSSDDENESIYQNDPYSYGFSRYPALKEQNSHESFGWFPTGSGASMFSTLIGAAVAGATPKPISYNLVASASHQESSKRNRNAIDNICTDLNVDIPLASRKAHQEEPVMTITNHTIKAPVQSYIPIPLNPRLPTIGEDLISSFHDLPMSTFVLKAIPNDIVPLGIGRANSAHNESFDSIMSSASSFASNRSVMNGQIQQANFMTGDANASFDSGLGSSISGASGRSYRSF